MELFKKVKELKKEGYNYKWCKHGQVYTIRGDGKAVEKVLSNLEIAHFDENTTKS